ncbi:hypothetical protein V6N13_004782 [Hibiscus sabdariffa]
MDGYRIRVFTARENVIYQTGREKKTPSYTFVSDRRRDAKSYKDVVVDKKRVIQGNGSGVPLRPQPEDTRSCWNEVKAEIHVLDE